ncbi:guanine nucleotide exchange factor for Rab-3A [Anabrus simplex]|uniref:guanine nucleotide exchange factor for Rab-3A n=1 Tax=Anabrus simplex TaxID=316456 RepID=UPI0035A2C631
MKAVETLPSQPGTGDGEALLMAQQTSSVPDLPSRGGLVSYTNPQAVLVQLDPSVINNGKVEPLVNGGRTIDVLVNGKLSSPVIRSEETNLPKTEQSLYSKCNGDVRHTESDTIIANGRLEERYSDKIIIQNGIARNKPNGDCVDYLKEIHLPNGDNTNIAEEISAPVENVQSDTTAARRPESLILSPPESCDTSPIIPNGIGRFQESLPRINGLMNGSSCYPTEDCVDGDSSDLRHNLINGVPNCESPTAHWDRAVAEVKEQAFARLQEELRKAHQELRLRDEEVTRLSRIREEVESELEELTASLFQEAHNMVREANVRQAAAERSYKESQMQVEVLQAEVAALKTLVLTSTPSRPNPHLHPQIDPRGSRSRDDASVAGVSLFNRKHRRSPSHFNLKYGRENSPPESPVKEQRTSVPEPLDSKDGWEVDPNIHKEFVSWKQNPKVDKSDPFIARVYNEDINLCLDFPNKELGMKVQEAIEKGNIYIEAVSDKNKTIFPKKCALLEAPRQCHYRMKLGDLEQWYYISQICRNRIIAVCDFLNYLRYIERGLVKSSVHDVYWEITRLRKEMVLARLGLALSS